MGYQRKSVEVYLVVMTARRNLVYTTSHPVGAREL